MSWGDLDTCKKLSGPKIESQLRNTFGQSLIVTLYVLTYIINRILILNRIRMTDGGRLTRCQGTLQEMQGNEIFGPT